MSFLSVPAVNRNNSCVGVKYTLWGFGEQTVDLISIRTLFADISGVRTLFADLNKIVSIYVRTSFDDLSVSHCK